MEAVRGLVADGLENDVRVIFHAGTYTLAAPLVFTAADSGAEKYSVTYTAAAGDTVILSGGRVITGWKRLEGSMWTAQLPDVKVGNWFFRQLVVDDRRAIRARWPNDDGTLHIATVDDGVKTFTFDKPLPLESLGGRAAELVVYQHWSVSRALVATSNDKQLTTATPVGWIGHGAATTASPGKTAFIENVRVGLDQPGEWFLDRVTGELTYLAADEDEPSAVAPLLSQLLKIAGTKDQPVRNLRFEGLRFEHTDFPLPEAGYSEIQAAHFGPSLEGPSYVQPVAIECSFAEDVQFERCLLAHLNNSGIGFGPGCRRNSVKACQIEDIGGAGVMIGWRGVGKLQPGAEGILDGDWAEPTEAPISNEVSNCLIRRCGVDSFGAPAIFVAFSADTRLAHNHIYDLPYTGISIGYRWDTTETSQVRCIVEYNHIHDVMQKLADGGGIYTLGYQPGTVFRGNLIHNVHRSVYAHGGAPNNGFFIDQGSQGFHFEANVVHTTSGDSVRFNLTNQESHTWKENAFDAAATPAIIEAARARVGVQPAYLNATDARDSIK